MKKRQILVIIFFLILTGLALYILSKTPSHNRNWKASASVMPTVKIDGNLVHIVNVRNFSFTEDEAGEIVDSPGYYDKTYDLDKIETVWFGMKPFEVWNGIAHTFISFGFSNGDYLAVSVEARLKEGEKYSPMAGMLRNYELIYQLGDENDIVKLRTNFGEKQPVYLYPIKTSSERVRVVFLDIMDRVSELNRNPEFYNTFTSNCTGNLVKHVNDLVPNRIPVWSIGTILPGFSDQLAYKLGLIDTNLDWEDVRGIYEVSARAKNFDPNLSSSDFSSKIREF